MKIELICNDELVNKHSDGGKRYGWSNPIDVIPPINTEIEYLTFNQNHKEGQGILTRYVVKNVVFTTEEDFNKSFRNKVCKVYLQKIN